MKAIETVYNGYRFRSRLEARWAVFFDALGIKYDYEQEGFDLDGVLYLPDFWLPEQKCWIEIKGQEPTQDETLKAYLLAQLKRYPVYIFPGSIDPQNMNSASGQHPIDWLILGHDPRRPADCEFTGEHPVCLLCARSCQYENSIPLPNEVAQAWIESERKYNQDVFHVTMQGGRIVRESPTGFNQIEGEPKFIPLPSPLDAYEAELGRLLSEHPHWLYSISLDEYDPATDDDYWAECPHCHKLGITYLGKSSVLPCRCAQRHDITENFEDNAISPRLIEAYTAARQARFEHGEKGLPAMAGQS